NQIVIDTTACQFDAVVAILDNLHRDDVVVMRATRQENALLQIGPNHILCQHATDGVTVGTAREQDTIETVVSDVVVAQEVVIAATTRNVNAIQSVVANVIRNRNACNCANHIVVGVVLNGDAVASIGSRLIVWV